MADFNPAIPATTTNPIISGEPKKRGGLDFRVYQDLKTGIHRDLLNKVDLEKVSVSKLLGRLSHCRRRWLCLRRWES